MEKFLEKHKCFFDFFKRLMKFCLKKTNYECSTETNDIALHTLDIIFVFIYFLLSLYNIITTFTMQKPPSYLMYFLNFVTLSRYFLSNIINTQIAKKQFIKENNNENIPDINVSSKITLIIVECITLCTSLIFIAMGRLFSINLFGIPTVSIVACVSFIIVITTLIEEFLKISISFYNAKPKIYKNVRQM